MMAPAVDDEHLLVVVDIKGINMDDIISRSEIFFTYEEMLV